LRLSLVEHPDGIETADSALAVYDVVHDTAHESSLQVAGATLTWHLGAQAPPSAALSAEVELAGGGEWVVRCDRIDFPPGGIAYRHVHPGPGIRRLLHGRLRIEGPDGLAKEFGPGAAWFEGADYAVLATAATTEPTAFVRVLLLPAEWAGRRTIRYLDPADEEKPKLQQATVLLERPLPPR
jgi:hypothetical protein